MHKPSALTVVCLAASLLTVTVITAPMLPATAATQQADEFAGRVVSAPGAFVVGGAATNPGHPVAGATVHLVPVTAMDVTSQMTASAIYAQPFPAEVYDEPLEDAIRLRGTDFPQSTTDSQGNFAIANVPDGTFFIHVTPGTGDVKHLPGGDQSRQSHSAEQLRGESMPIRISSSPSPAAHAVGSSTCLECHQNQEHWQRTAHKLGWTVPGAPGPMQDFSRHPDYFNALDSFPETNEYPSGTHLELGDYDADRGDDKFKLRAFGDSRLPIETTYADVYLWKNTDDGKYYITMVNSLNSQDPNSPAHLEIKLLYGGAVHDQRYIVSVPPTLADRRGVVYRAAVQHDRARQQVEPSAASVARLQVLPLVGLWRGRPIRDCRRRDRGAAGQHEYHSNHVRQLSFDGLGTV